MPRSGHTARCQESHQRAGGIDDVLGTRSNHLEREVTAIIKPQRELITFEWHRAGRDVEAASDLEHALDGAGAGPVLGADNLLEHGQSVADGGQIAVAALDRAKTGRRFDSSEVSSDGWHAFSFACVVSCHGNG